MTVDGITRPAERNGVAIQTPVVLTGRDIDVQRGVELVGLAWRRGGRWQRVTAERKQVANKNTLLDLAGAGLPVHSGTAAALAHFLAEYELANLCRMPAARVTSQLGWQGREGRDGFLWGRVLITAEGESDPDAPGDAGDEQLGAGFHRGGTFRGWREAVSLIEPFPRVRLALYLAFVPPLLPVVQADNFAADFAGPTSGGKTTALAVAGSVWGRPERAAGSGTVMADWNSTGTWKERAAVVLNHLPFLVDDTKTLRFGDEVAQTIFAFTQGRSRGRGTTQGVALQQSFQSVLLTSGEQPLASFGEHGGIRPRILTLWGTPFGETSTAVGAVVTALRHGVTRNYGHAGPRFVRRLAADRSHWPTLRRYFADLVEEYTALAGNNAVAGRMASHFAAITTASRLVHKFIKMPWEWEDPILPLFGELTAEAAEADRAAAALRHAVGWAVAHRQDFFCAGRPATDQPSGGWMGRWERDGGDNPALAGATWPWIGFMPHVLKRVLGEGGFEPDSTLRNWKDRGWLKCTDGRSQFRSKLGHETAWLVAVRREAVKTVGGAG
jgi:hypothetical protein